jgi:hypothetical protein
MESDPARIPAYVLASSVVLTLVIVCAGSLRGGRAPHWAWAAVAATAISTIGILFAKFGAGFGLPWQVYYSVPMLATVLIPPALFRLNLWRAIAYIGLAFATAPLIHAAFFYGLGWGDYMPFLPLPR